MNYIDFIQNNILDNVNYAVIFIMMILESTILPPLIPTEVFLLSVGCIITINNLSFPFVIFIATAGVLIGSLFNYSIGYLFHVDKIFKFLKKLNLKEDRFVICRNMLEKNWKLTLFFGRWLPIPGVKHFVAIPCGMIKVNVLMFIVITTLGAFLLNTFYLYLGYKFGKEVAFLITNHFKKVASVLILTLFFVYLIRRVLKFIFKKTNKPN